MVSWGSNAPIKAVDLATYAVSTLSTTSLSNIDGIDMDGQGNFYIAAWSPDRIIRYNTDFSESTIISVPGLNNPADICYATAIDTLAIPNTAGNNILFVGFAPISATPNSPNELRLDFSVSPNPLTEEGYLLFGAPVSGSARSYIYDARGSLVFAYQEEVVGGSEACFPLRTFRAAPGLYTCMLCMEESCVVKKVVKL